MNRRSAYVLVIASALLASLLLAGCSQQSAAASNSSGTQSQQNAQQSKRPFGNGIMLGKVTSVSGNNITVSLAEAPAQSGEQDQSGSNQNREQAGGGGSQQGGGSRGGVSGMVSALNGRPSAGVGRGGSSSSSSDSDSGDLSKPMPTIDIPSEFTGGSETIVVTDSTKITDSSGTGIKTVDISKVTVGKVISVRMHKDSSGTEVVASIEILQ